METNYWNLTRAKLEQLAIERFGSMASAYMMAEKEALLHESILRHKAPWVRALQKPLNPQDLGKIASHETWAADIRDKICKGEKP